MKIPHRKFLNGRWHWSVVRQIGRWWLVVLMLLPIAGALASVVAPSSALAELAPQAVYRRWQAMRGGTEPGEGIRYAWSPHDYTMPVFIADAPGSSDDPVIEQV